MKKSKLLSILFMPVIAIGSLVGCSSSRTATSPYFTFNNMQLQYGTQSGLQDKENKYENNVYDSATNKLFYVKGSTGSMELTCWFDPTYQLNALSNADINLIRTKQNVGTLDKDNKTYQGYYAVFKIQDSIIKGVYNYYNNWASRFYYSIEKCKPTKTEIKELNKRMDNLVNVITTFNNAKTDFENSVNISADVNVHNFVFSSFCKSYNDLIEYSISFVDYFKTLHVKYIVGNNVYTSADDANRVKDEAVLNIAKILYYENLKSANYTICDLSKLSNDLLNASMSGTEVTGLTNTYARYLYKFVNKQTSSITNTGHLWDEGTIMEYQLLQNPEFKTLANAFNQKISLYMNVYGSVDMYAYDRARSGYGTTSLESFLASQSSIMRSRYNFIDDFFNSTFGQYADYVLESYVTK